MVGGSLASVAGVLRRREEAAVSSSPFRLAVKEATDHLPLCRTGEIWVLPSGGPQFTSCYVFGPLD